MRGLILALVCLMSTPAIAAPAKLPPVDECAADKGMAAFRGKLARAVENRDAKGLSALLAPDVLINFGGETGRKAFAAQWEPQDKGSELWPLLRRLLTLGCAKSDAAWVIPSLGLQFEGDDDEVFDVMIVSQPGAKLRETSDPAGKVAASLDWDVVRPTTTAGDLQTKVKLADGREGWLFDDQLYSPLDYRMVIGKKSGQWRITAFVAGD